jgi:hypothetical protein
MPFLSPRSGRSIGRDLGHLEMTFASEVDDLLSVQLNLVFTTYDVWSMHFSPHVDHQG